MEDKDGSQFIFQSVRYRAIRDNLDIELKDAVAEFNIFEDLSKSYLTGSILIGDDTGLMDEVKTKGDERVTLIIAKNPAISEGEPYFRLDFKVVSILRQEKTADRAEVLSLNLISDYAYNNSVIKISKSYTGKLEKISESILKNFLDVELALKEFDLLTGKPIDTEVRPDEGRITRKYYDDEQGSEQEAIKLLVPYLSPLETVEWLTERATDRWGTPFFLWASIWGQDMSETTTLRLGNFMTMVQEGITSLNDQTEKTDFIYSQVQTNLKAPEGYKGAMRIIKGIKLSNIENTLKMIREGAVGSTISNLDTYTTQSISKLYSATRFLNSLNGGGPQSDPEDEFAPYPNQGGKILGTVFDQQDQLRIADEVRPTSYWSARQRSTVTSYGTYASTNSIHEAIDDSSLLNKVRPLALRSMLARNMIEIMVDGIGILEDKLSVGDIIKVQFVTEDTESRALGGSNLERSGYYLIQNCRHIFAEERHDVVLMICKVAQTEIINDDSLYEPSELSEVVVTAQRRGI